ncbi:MAG: four helix bundle protein [Candidatus Sulfotelmatobacter sp.]
MEPDFRLRASAFGLRPITLAFSTFHCDICHSAPERQRNTLPAEDNRMSGTYRDLEVWQAAMKMVFDVYRDTATFPKQEMFGLTSQLRRAAVSVASNIAEGKGRFSDRDLSQFLSVARGSVFEIETQLAIAEELGFLAKPQSKQLLSRCAEVGRLLNGLIKVVRKPAA